MIEPVNHVLGGQDWVKDVVVRLFVKTSEIFKVVSSRSSETENRVLRNF